MTITDHQEIQIVVNRLKAGRVPLAAVERIAYLMFLKKTGKISPEQGEELEVQLRLAEAYAQKQSQSHGGGCLTFLIVLGLVFLIVKLVIG